MLYDFVILLSGNSYITRINQTDIPKTDASIKESLSNPNVFFQLTDGNRTAQIRAGAVLGWYFKPHEKSVQEKMFDVVKKSVEPDGDSWKSNDVE